MRRVLLCLVLCAACAGGDEPGTSCTVAGNPDGSATITCPDGTQVVLFPGRDGRDGRNGLDGEDGLDGVNGRDGEDGADGRDGANGSDGAPGADAEPCRVEERADGSRVVACPDGSEAVLVAGRRRHVILFVGDGMPLASEIAASRYLHGTDFGLSMHAMPYQGFATTWDTSTYNVRAALSGRPYYDPLTFDPRTGYDPALGGDRPYPLLPDSPALRSYFFPTGPAGQVVYWAPDSASSATAMATGVKTASGNIAWLPGDPADGALETVAARLRRERGFAVGLVSTVPFSHATPAAFAAHNVDRGNLHAIAEELLEQVRPEVLIGGGHPAYYPGFTYLSQATYDAQDGRTDLVFVQRAAGVAGGPALAAAASLAASSGRRLLGLFGGRGGDFEWGAPAHAPGAPSIAPGSPENPTLAEATIAALEVLARNQNGLFLLAEQGDIDHANHGNDFGHMIASVHDLDRAVRAVADYVDRPGDALDWSNTTVIVTADHANGFMRFGPRTLGAGELPGTPLSDWITWSTGSHTNELVPVHARGAGATLFWRHANVYAGKPLVDNTAVHHVILSAARGEP